MITNCLLIGLGGFLGSIARYLASLAALRLGAASFPVGTLAINVTGSLLIGLIYGWSAGTGGMAPGWRLFLATGFCGGFTTFSAFSFECITLLKEGNLWYVFLYICGSVLTGIGACFLGLAAAR